MANGWRCFATDRPRCQRVTKVQRKVPWPLDQHEVPQDPLHQNADRLELANQSTSLSIVQETEHSSILSHSSVLKFVPDLSEKQLIPLFHCIDGAEWDDI